MVLGVVCVWGGGVLGVESGVCVCVKRCGAVGAVLGY